MLRQFSSALAAFSQDMGDRMEDIVLEVYGKWPGLEKEQLFEGRDLAVTTDYRAVLSELIRGHLGQKELGPVFPGYQLGDPMGLLRS